MAKQLSEEGLPNRSIAAGMGVAYSTLAMWLQKAREDPDSHPHFVELSDAMREGALKGEQANLAKIRAKAHEDIRASTWLLSHSPKWRDTWSDASRTRQEVNRVVDLFVAALNDDDTLTPAQRERVLLVVKSKGLVINTADIPEE